MADNRNKSDGGVFDVIIYGMMIAAVIYVIIQCILGNNDTLHFKLTLGIWIVLAVAVADFIGPVVTGRLNGISSKAAVLYTVYAMMDAVVYAGLYIFVINVNMTKEPLHYIFLGIGVVFFIAKTIVNGKFRKMAVNPDDDDDDMDGGDYEGEPKMPDESEDDDLKVLVYRNK